MPIVKKLFGKDEKVTLYHNFPEGIKRFFEISQSHARNETAYLTRPLATLPLPKGKGKKELGLTLARDFSNTNSPK